jgi:hypothetical protein
MSDMYGAVKSNTFKVKDPNTFEAWFTTHVRFGENIQLWRDTSDSFSFGGYEQYPVAFPNTPWSDDKDSTEWDLEEFGKEMAKRLADDSYLQVIAGGNEKLRYVSFSILIIFPNGEAKFKVFSSDDDHREDIV